MPDSLPRHGDEDTFGTEAAAAGVPLAVLQVLMGHTDITTTLRYVDDRQKRDAITIAFGPRGSHVASTAETQRK